MNSPLATSLAEAVAALSAEDFQTFQAVLLSHMVQKTPGVAGGHACIRNTRVAVWTLISLQHQGADDNELLHNFPGLTPFDLIAARAYYASHTEEIDSAIADIHDAEVPSEGESTPQILTIKQNSTLSSFQS